MGVNFIPKYGTFSKIREQNLNSSINCRAPLKTTLLGFERIFFPTLRCENPAIHNLLTKYIDLPLAVTDVAQPTLNLATLKDLAATYEKELSWEHFSAYYSEDIGSGFYILRYPIAGSSYHLLIGGYSTDYPPEYIRLVLSIDSSQYIEIRMDVPWTNGYIEGCNNKTKVLKRVSYGMRNFNNFRKENSLLQFIKNRAGALTPTRSKIYSILALPQLLT